MNMINDSDTNLCMCSSKKQKQKQKVVFKCYYFILDTQRVTCLASFQSHASCMYNVVQEQWMYSEGEDMSLLCIKRLLNLH